MSKEREGGKGSSEERGEIYIRRKRRMEQESKKERKRKDGGDEGMGKGMKKLVLE